jgi:hypothetical protein
LKINELIEKFIIDVAINLDCSELLYAKHPSDKAKNPQEIKKIKLTYTAR